MDVTGPAFAHLWCHGPKLITSRGLFNLGFLVDT